MKLFKYKLGQDIILKINGKTYSIIARTEYLTSENKYWVMSEDAMENIWVKESDLKPTKKQ